jgi:AsmA protein
MALTRGTRRALWIAGALLALIAAAAIAVPYFVDINRYHDLIERQAEQTLGRDVTIGKMSLVLFPIPGVSIEPLAIASDRPGDPPLLKTESLSARARLLPLLRGEMTVASLVAHRPELHFRRYRDGRWNLPTVAATPPGPGAAPPARRDAGGGLSLARLRIRDARLTLTDEAVVPGKTVRTTLEGVGVELDDYAPGRPFGLAIEMRLPPKSSGSLRLAGTLAPPPATPGRPAGTTDLVLSIEKLRPAAFAPYIRSFTGFSPPAGSLSADLEVRANLATAADGTWELQGDGSLRGDIEVRDLELPEAAGRTGGLDLALDVSLEEGGRLVVLRKVEASSGRTRLKAGGTLDLRDRAMLEAQVRPSQVMAEDLATVAALLGAKFPPGLSSSRPISFRGSVAGPLEDPERLRFEGEIELAGVRYADPGLGSPVEDIGGKLRFAAGAMTVKGLTARVGETVVGGEIEVREFSSPKVRLALSAKKANLDELLGLLTPSSPAPAASPKSAGPDDVLARTSGSGTIRIDEGSFGTFRFSRFEGNLRLAGKVVTFDPVSFRLYGGTYAGALTADLRGKKPAYAYRSRLQNVDGRVFLEENLGIKDLLAGTVSADLALEARGGELQEILDTLKGGGTIRVAQGWIGQLNVLGGLAKASDVLGEKTLASVSRNLAKERTEFSELTGDLQVSGGRVASRNLRVATRNLDLEGKGHFTLAGNLDLDLRVLFSTELTDAMIAEGSRARYLDREDGRIVFPLTIRGPLASPTYGVDVTAITRAAAKGKALERLAESKSPLGEIAAGLLGRKTGTPPPTQPSEREPQERDLAGPEPAPAPAAPGAESTGIRVTSIQSGGNLLLPDLTIRGEFAGDDLARADLKIQGKGGRTVYEQADAFREITAFYAANDRTRPARIPFKLKIDGKRLAGAGDLTITITLHRADGTSTVSTFREERRGL